VNKLAKGKKVYTGIALDKHIIEEVDRRRREKALAEGRDISRSAFISMLIMKALESKVS
jgi:hypothetical protein